MVFVWNVYDITYKYVLNSIEGVIFVYKKSQLFYN